ncbi:MAG: alcohol dehydrogenase catalytic domain-containing protein [Candidatus Hydrogenedentota bacterium]
MKAIKLSQPKGEVTLAEVEIPTPGPGEILVKVEASGLCYTDVHLCDGDWEIVDPLVKRDLTLGHEAVGVVEALGDGVTNRAIGDRIAAPFLRSSCGECKQCRRGEENHCPNVTVLGMTHDGSHAEYVVVLADFVVPVPDGVRPEQAAPLACAGMSVLGGLRNAKVSVGTVFGVVGVGGQGHLAIQLAKIMGATVVAMDINSDKLELARRVGADHTVDVTQPEAIEELTAMGMDVIMVTAPSHDAHRLALTVVAHGGTISLCAVPGGETPISMTMCAFKGLKLLTQAVATRRELIDILDLAAAGKIECEVETRPLEDAPESINQLRDATISGRIVFVP